MRCRWMPAGSRSAEGEPAVPAGGAVLALTQTRLIDGTGAAPRDDVTVVIAEGRITALTDRVPAGATVLDLGGRSLLPGLIDAHVHLSSLGLPQPELQGRDLAPDLRAYGLAAVARATLEGGVTTVRDCGAYGSSLFTLRRAIELGVCAGPRLLLSGLIVSATSPGARAFPGMYREADGPDELRDAVREQVRMGADFIKVMATGALTVADEDVDPPQLTLDGLRAVVEEAHRSGRRLAAHAEGLEGIRLAVEAGADTIEHGEMGHLDAGVLATMAARGTVLVPTLSVFDAVADAGDRFPAWMRERAARLGEAARRTVRAARAAGVRIAMGADAGPHGANAQELVRLADAGLTPMEAVVAATSVAAAACGIDGDVGVIAPGLAADLVVVDGDPLDDVGVLADPKRRWLVIQAGIPVAGTAMPAAQALLGR